MSFARAWGMRLRWKAVGFGASALLALSCFGGSTASAADPCPNGAVREQQQATALPDCRAFEMVSPPDKNGGDVLHTTSEIVAAEDGGRVKFASLLSFGSPEGASAVSQYLATREGGWKTVSIVPPQSSVGNFAKVPWLSLDLAKAVVFAHDNEPALAPEATPGVFNVYLRDNLAGTYGLLTIPSGGVTPPSYTAPVFSDATPDGSHVVFRTTTRWTADAPAAGNKLYEYDAGANVLRLVGIQPGSTLPVTGGATGGGQFQTTAYPENLISDDGQRIYFSSPSTAATGKLYLRIGGAETVLVSQSEATVPGASRPSTFRGAGRDGLTAYFTSDESLVDADADEGKVDLYAYDASRPASEPDNLTLVSADAEPADPDAAGVGVEGVVGVSDSGDAVYFVSRDQLVAGGPIDGGPKLYLWQKGSPTRYVATLDPGDDGIWSNASFLQSGDPRGRRLSPDGSELVFVSRARLTAYDNAGQAMVYLYDADGSGLVCVSCDPGGGAPTGPAVLDRGAPGLITPGGTTNVSRAFLDDGSRIYFDTPDSLVADDSNGLRDVYQYDVASGRASLISSGFGNYPAMVGDASANGEDVFFLTRQRLVGADRDNNVDLYDARVGGGQLEVVGRPGCVPENCQPPPGAPSPASAPGSLGVAAGGNGAAARCQQRKRAKASRKRSARAARKKAARASAKKAKRASRAAAKCRKGSAR